MAKAKAEHWHNQEWRVLAINDRHAIVGPDHRCLESTLKLEHVQEICSMVNRVYKLGLKRGRQSVFRDAKERRGGSKKRSKKR